MARKRTLELICSGLMFILIFGIIILSSGCINDGVYNPGGLPPEFQAMMNEARQLGWENTTPVGCNKVDHGYYYVVSYRNVNYEAARNEELSSLMGILGLSNSSELDEVERMQKSFMALGWIDLELSTTDKALAWLSGVNITKEVQKRLDAELEQQLSNLGIRIVNQGPWELKESGNDRRVYLKHVVGEYPLGSVDTRYGSVDLGTLKIDVDEYLVLSGDDYGIVVLAVPEDYRRTFTLYPIDNMELTVDVQWELHDESLLNSAERIVGVIR